MNSSMNARSLAGALVLMLTISQSSISGFTTAPKRITQPVVTRKTELRGISKWNSEHQLSDDDNDGSRLITNEIFMRDMLSEPALRKKKGAADYRPHDNRDALPFIVRVKTPDPYTEEGVMLQQARKNSDAAKKNNHKKGARRRNLVGMDGHANAIAASVYARKKDGSLYKVLGQFELEKNTNCGDLVQVGDREFEVVTARSQFK